MKKVLFCLVIISGLIMAQNYAEFTAAKVIGMGGAYTAIANDENALFYNPAGLAFIDPGMLGHVNAEGTMRFDDGFQKIQEALDPYRDPNTDQVNWGDPAIPGALAGKAGQVGVAGGLSYFTSGFALGAHQAIRSEFVFDSSGRWGNFHSKGILSLGLANKVIDNLSVGATFKAVMVEAFRGSDTYATLSANASDETKIDASSYLKGTNLAANVGLMYKVGNFSAGASIENFWASDIDWEDASGNKVNPGSAYGNVMKPMSRVGIGYSNKDTLIALDMANLDDSNNSTFHAGIQQKLLAIPFISWLGDVTVRAGYLSGKEDSREMSSTSFGASFRILIARLNIVTVMKKIADAELSEIALSGQFSF